MTINKEQAVSDAVERVEESIRISQRGWKPSSYTMCEVADLRTILDAMKSASHPLEQQQAVSGDVVERVADAIEKARCIGREGPFGGYDYGHNPDFYGPPPEGGRYVIRDFRDPSSPDWGKWLHQTDDKTAHQALFEKMTREHYARAALTASGMGRMREALELTRKALLREPYLKMRFPALVPVYSAVVAALEGDSTALQEEGVERRD